MHKYEALDFSIFHMCNKNWTKVNGIMAYIIQFHIVTIRNISDALHNHVHQKIAKKPQNLNILKCLKSPVT